MSLRLRLERVRATTAQQMGFKAKWVLNQGQCITESLLGYPLQNQEDTWLNTDAQTHVHNHILCHHQSISASLFTQKIILNQRSDKNYYN